MSAQAEVWRVSTVEGIFETDLETLKQWILEGCVAPTDKVSKGNLSWIEAGRVPKLKGAFNGEPVSSMQPPNTSFESFVDSTPAFNSTPAIASWVEPVRLPPSTPAASNVELREFLPRPIAVTASGEEDYECE